MNNTTGFKFSLSLSLSLNLSLPPICTHILTCSGVGISDLRPLLLVFGVLPVAIAVEVEVAGELEVELELAVDVELTVNVSLALAAVLGETVAPPPDSLLCGARD